MPKISARKCPSSKESRPLQDHSWEPLEGVPQWGTKIKIIQFVLRTDYSIFDGKTNVFWTPTLETSHLKETIRLPASQLQSEAPSLQLLKGPRQHICRCDVLGGDPQPQHTPSDLPVKSAAARWISVFRLRHKKKKANWHPEHSLHVWILRN